MDKKYMKTQKFDNFGGGGTLHEFEARSKFSFYQGRFNQERLRFNQERLVHIHSVCENSKSIYIYNRKKCITLTT